MPFEGTQTATPSRGERRPREPDSSPEENAAKKTATSPLLTVSLPSEAPPYARALLEHITLVLSKLNSIEDKLGTFDNKLTELDDKINQVEEELGKSINYAQVVADEALDRVDKIEKELLSKKEHLTAEIAKLNRENKALHDRIVKTESQARRNNLIFSGIPEERNEKDADCVRKVRAVLHQMGHLDPSRVKIARAHRLSPHTPGRPRPIITKFEFYEDRQAALAHRNCLRNTSIYVDEDFPPEISQKRRLMQPIVKAAKARGYENVALKYDRIHVNGKSYGVDNLNDLPQDIHPHAVSSQVSDSAFVFFSKLSPLSNFGPYHIKVTGEDFENNEKFIQVSKARIFGDEETEYEIMRETDPVRIKALGRKVKNFDREKWAVEAEKVLRQCNMVKYETYPALKTYLKATGKKRLGEATVDNVFGTGLSLSHKDAANPLKWTGKNIMGKCLEEIRATL